MSHLLLIIRIHEESGSRQARRYVILLQERLRHRIQAGEHFSLSQAIAHRDQDIWNLILNEITSQRAVNRRVRATGSVADDLVPRQPAVPPPPELQAGRGGPRPPSSTIVTGSVVGGSSSSTSAFRVRAPICLLHDPALGRFCPNQATCQKVHLDTSIPAQASRYRSAATAAYRSSHLRIADAHG